MNDKKATSEMFDACTRYLMENRSYLNIIKYCITNKHYTWETILDNEDNVIYEERIITVDNLEDACEELEIPFSII